MLTSYKKSLYAAFIVVFCLALGLHSYAQSGGSSGSINGTVLDPSGAVVANAKVEIHNPVSGFDRTTTTDSKGNFSFTNVPFNPYHMTVTAAGFAQYAQDVEVRSVVPVTTKVSLTVAGGTATVTVESAGDLVENDPTFHSDIDKELFDKLPLESASSSLSSLVTLSTPGIAADSNGLFHGIGDHAENSFSVDGQPITDQQSKVFSNQTRTASTSSRGVRTGRRGCGTRARSTRSSHSRATRSRYSPWRSAPTASTSSARSADTTVKVWDADTGPNSAPSRDTVGMVNSVAFSPDGKRLVSGSGTRR